MTEQIAKFEIHTTCRCGAGYVTIDADGAPGVFHKILLAFSGTSYPDAEQKAQAFIAEAGLPELRGE